MELQKELQIPFPCPKTEPVISHMISKFHCILSKKENQTKPKTIISWYEWFSQVQKIC